MGTINISLPDRLKAFVDEQVTTRGFGSSSEYVRELIQKDQERNTLRAILVAGATSARAGVADEQYFEGLRRHARIARSGEA